MRTDGAFHRPMPSQEFSFTALSVGIGIGALRPPGPAPSARNVVNKAPGDSQVTRAIPQVADAPQVRGQAPRVKGLGFSHRILAYGLDFFFVALTLAVALALATVLSAVRTGETENWLATKPIQWLAGLNPFAIVGGVYGAFFAYALVFKVLAGKTVGEGLLGVSRKISPKTVKA